MKTERVPIYVYGLDPAEVDSPDAWEKAGLRAQPIAAGAPFAPDAGIPVVVTPSEAPGLVRHFEAEGLENEIVLFLPENTERPKGVYVDAVIRPRELPALALLVTHPQQFQLRRFAEDVPLALLAQPVQTLDLHTLNLPDEFVQHLDDCPTCPGAFREAIKQRVRLYQSLACPNPRALIDFARTQQSASNLLEAHVQTCPLCRTQMQALRAALLPRPDFSRAPLPDPLSSPLALVDMSPGGVSVEEARSSGGSVVLPEEGSKLLIEIKGVQGVEAVEDKSWNLKVVQVPRYDFKERYAALLSAFGPLVDLFDRVARGQVPGWEIAGIRSSGMEEPPQTDTAEFVEWVASTLEFVQDERSFVALNQGPRQLVIGWDDSADAPYLESAGLDAGTNRGLTLELRAGDEQAPLWEMGVSQGRMLIPVSTVQSAFDKYNEEQGQSPTASPTQFTLDILEGMVN